MKYKWLMLTVLLASLMVLMVRGNAAAESGTIPTKQVAAPPSDFANLALQDPALSGIRSHAAMIPVSFSQGKDGLWSWAGNLPVDSTENVALMILSPNSAAWSVQVTQPSGKAVLLNETAVIADVTHESTTLSIGEMNGYPAEVYRFGQAETGSWQVHIATTQSGVRDGYPDGYILLSSKSDYQLYTHLSTHNLTVGSQVGLVTYAYNNALQGDTTGAPTVANGVVQAANLVVTYPDGSQANLAMADDGAHADGLAGDGVFGALVDTSKAGDYVAQVTVTGQTAVGQAFIRTSEHYFPVIAPMFNLDSRPARTAVVDSNHLTVNIRANALSKVNGNVQVSAEVWGTTSEGTLAPVVWLSGMVTPKAQLNGGYVLPLTLDASWVALSKTKAPFELRNVRVQDINTHIPMAQATTLALQVARLPEGAAADVTAVSDEMLMGVKPALENNNATNAGVLMLIHGYCSGNVWPTGNFTQYALFQDLGQNRTHDQFAQLIRNFGNNYSSFGAVAHSQGGAASLHLYTYYWSGLDNSSGSRLIQSVGTPYQGTALAGNLAVLGQIFGVGCGSNFDLTYDGASLWLSGIPSWARSRVYYHTTSFTDVWWRYDYCHVASDLLLSDPDDGTTEKWAGQLTGANNLGHKTGWCHTSGMRDPAQTTDSARNANMNTYGNR